jgi:hypothetical protein
MSSITRSEPQLQTPGFVRLFGLACLIGGLMWFV